MQGAVTVEIIIDESPIKPIIKLELPTDLPSESGYDPLSEPQFWKPIFNDNEMMNTTRKFLAD